MNTLRKFALVVSLTAILTCAPTAAVASPGLLIGCDTYSAFSCLPGNVGFLLVAGVGAVASAPVALPIWGVEKFVSESHPVSSKVVETTALVFGGVGFVVVGGPFYLIESVLYRGPKYVIEKISGRSLY